MQRFKKILSEASKRERSNLKFGTFVKRKKRRLMA